VAVGLETASALAVGLDATIAVEVGGISLSVPLNPQALINTASNTNPIINFISRRTVKFPDSADHRIR
jgi:hypothetical protein